MGLQVSVDERLLALGWIGQGVFARKSRHEAVDLMVMQGLSVRIIWQVACFNPGDALSHLWREQPGFGRMGVQVSMHGSCRWRGLGAAAASAANVLSLIWQPQASPGLGRWAVRQGLGF